MAGLLQLGPELLADRRCEALRCRKRDRSVRRVEQATAGLLVFMRCAISDLVTFARLISRAIRLEIDQPSTATC
jgi:hypothetical protein